MISSAADGGGTVRLLLNDLDALPLVNRAQGLLATCGQRPIVAAADGFTPPEQVWPWPDEPFDSQKMPPYCEKTDVWKLAFVLRHLLGDAPLYCRRQVTAVLSELQAVTAIVDPRARPTMWQLRSLLGRLFAEAAPVVLDVVGEQ